MNSFRNNRLRDHETPLSTVWLLNDIAESRGKQELFTRQSPQALKALRDTAVIQSAESSNRIEGVTVAQARLYPLVLGQAKPRDRSEQEGAGLSPRLERDSLRLRRAFYYAGHPETPTCPLPIRQRRRGSIQTSR